jgi:AMP-activated protein kinase-like protein
VRERRRTAYVALHAAWLAALLPDALAAQSSHGVAEIGAARLSQRAVPRTDAVTAGVSGRRDGSRYALAAAGGVTLADEGRSTSQGLLAASLLGRPGRTARWEIGGAVTAFGQSASPMTRGAYVVAREHFAVGGFGGWAGFGIGGVVELNRWSPTRTAEATSWFTRRGTRLTAAALVVDTRSEPYGPEGQLVTDPITYADGSLGMRWTFRRRVDVEARGGIRFISRGALTTTGRGTRPFAAVDAAVWVTPHVAVVAAMGRQLSDLARGTPDTRFAALALRFTVRERTNAPPPMRRPPIGGQLRLTLVTDTSGQSHLVVTAPSGVAALVELAGSFTDWEPVPLVRRGEVWELDRSLQSGAHRVLVRVDGGPWIVPANLPAADDDFGGTVGIITIP